ncbi:MAG TPA: Calx-beta domain-containing protein [Thermoanaerobaculia bacterium]
MTHRSILPALALGFLLAASASAQHHAASGKVDYDPEPGGGDPNPPAGCAGVQAKIAITGGSTAFSPATMTVDPGQPVCWSWSGTPVQHNVKADDGSFTSGPPDNRGTFQRTFTTPGTYGYHCQVHGSLTGGMRGTIVVRDTSGGGGGEGQGPGTLALAPTAYTVDEGAGSLTVTVERMGGSDGAATVKYATANGTAKAGKDFLPRAGILRWASGDEAPKTFSVPIKNDSAREPDESFAVKLSKATGAALGASSATVTVHDDDTPGCPASLTAPSHLRALGQSASEIRLTWADESGAASAFRIERRQPGGAFQEIAVVAAAADGFTDSGLPGGATFQYRVRAEGADGLSAFSSIAAGATDGPTAPCDETRALCLHGGRFEATVQWRRPATAAGGEARRATLPEAPGSGLFSSSRRDGLQLLLNVHDGCNVNDHYWLDFAAVSDEEFTLRVRDTQTGRTWVYFNPAGSAPAPVRDVDAFATCP